MCRCQPRSYNLVSDALDPHPSPSSLPSRPKASGILRWPVHPAARQSEGAAEAINPRPVSHALALNSEALWRSRPERLHGFRSDEQGTHKPVASALIGRDYGVDTVS